MAVGRAFIQSLQEIAQCFAEEESRANAGRLTAFSFSFVRFMIEDTVSYAKPQETDDTRGPINNATMASEILALALGVVEVQWVV